MIEIVHVDELVMGDTILIEGKQESEILIVEVEYITDQQAIILKECAGMDYVPEDPERIVRIGSVDEEPIMNPVSNKLHFKLNKEWQKVFEAQ